MHMHRKITLTVLFSALVASPLFAQGSDSAQVLTPEMALSLRIVSDLLFSPDGTRLAFVVTEVPEGTSRQRHIWVLNIKTHDLKQFTYSTKSEYAPRWSPDGARLAFLSDRGDFTQIYLISADGGEARTLTSGKRSVQAFAWSPDGSRIAFLAPEPPTEQEEKKHADKDDARVVDKDDKHSRVWIMRADSGKARAVTQSDWQVNALEWLPTGNHLIVTATNHPESDEVTNRIYDLDPEDGFLHEIVAPRGVFGDVRISPDGKAVYYVGTRVDGPEPHDLFVVPLAGGVARNLTATSVDRPIEHIEWRSDDSLLALVGLGFRNGVVALTTDGARGGTPPLDMNVGPFTASHSGQVAFVGQTATEPPELYLWDLRGAPVQASHFNDSWRHVTLGKIAHFHYKSFDGLVIEAALLTPAGYDGRTRLPLVALIHGGPTGSWHDAVEPWGELLAARGYAVLYPNIRGSTGYGEKFVELNRGDWGGNDFKDVMAGVDAAIARGVGDPDRLGIGGWSYGGYMAEWAITQTNRFKAAVSGAGMANLISEFGTETFPAYDHWFYGWPYEQPQGFLKSSPFMYLKNARTPTLILQGEEDRTDPLGQSQELYRGLKHYGVEAEMVVYPREPHGLREEKHLLDRLNRIVGWCDAHLKP
jgi:dipeptidyl aminopeptidase/acylaminoacyl peptidase